MDEEKKRCSVVEKTEIWPYSKWCKNDGDFVLSPTIAERLDITDELNNQTRLCMDHRRVLMQLGWL